MPSCLDEYLMDEVRKDLVIELTENALENFDRHDQYFTKVELNKLIEADENEKLKSHYTGDVDKKYFEKVGWYFWGLLKGTLTTTASNAPVLP